MPILIVYIDTNNGNWRASVFFFLFCFRCISYLPNNGQLFDGEKGRRKNWKQCFCLKTRKIKCFFMKFLFWLRGGRSRKGKICSSFSTIFFVLLFKNCWRKYRSKQNMVFFTFCLNICSPTFSLPFLFIHQFNKLILPSFLFTYSHYFLSTFFLLFFSSAFWSLSLNKKSGDEGGKGGGGG